jgi:hypothetical protein
MPWVLILFLIPLVLFVVAARRMIRIGRLIRDPEQLRSLLSDETRAALRDTGFDPDSVNLQELQESEELSNLVAADLRRLLRPLFLGLPLPGSPGAPDAAHLHLDQKGDLRTPQWSAGDSDGAGQPVLPPPIDQPSDPRIRIVVALAIVGLIVVAIFVFGSQR